MEELETKNPDFIFPFFRTQNNYVLKIKHKWLLPSENKLELRSIYKLNLVFKKFSLNSYKGYYIREIAAKDKE